MSVSGDYGIVNQIEFQGRSFAGASVSNYGVVQTGDVVYTKSPLNSNPYGIIKTNKGKPGIVSTLYAVYHPKKNAFSDFIQVYFEQHARMNNYMHAKDTSNKIKAIFDARMKDGKRCSGSIPYGYNRLPSDKQTLVVDPVASEVVKRIFTLANDGKSTRAIAEILTEEKVLTPAAYAKEYHPEQYNGNKFTKPTIQYITTG